VLQRAQLVRIWGQSIRGDNISVVFPMNSKLPLCNKLLPGVSISKRKSNCKKPVALGTTIRNAKIGRGPGPARSSMDRKEVC
jgi:hypothetical protein